MRAHIKAYLSASKVRFFLTFGKEVILLRSLDHVCELLNKFAVNNQVIIPKVEGPRNLKVGYAFSYCSITFVMSSLDNHSFGFFFHSEGANGANDSFNSFLLSLS